MRRPRLLVAPVAIVAVASLACDVGTLPPRGQIVLHVSTDAPLPMSSACPSQPTDVPPLFDRVRFDVFEPNATTPMASRTFPIDCALVDSGGASIGIAPAIGVTGYVAEVRIFRGTVLENGAPLESAALDSFVALPVVASDGIIDVTVDLPTSSVGTPIGTLTSPIAATLGTPAKGEVGSWAPAHRTMCSAPAKPGEACVPGGAYWMGNPNVGGVYTAADATTPRLVVLSPFYIDELEVPVSAFRASGVARPPGGPFMNGDPVDSGGAMSAGCKYSSSPVDQQDQLPVNCVTWQTARAYCMAAGKDLPTEAQFEYVDSGFRSATYTWGEDDPACGDVVFASAKYPTVPLSCFAAGAALNGPVIAGSGKLDRIVLPGGGLVVDLAGNLREWTRDAFAPQTDPCWNVPLLTDPVCQATTDLRTIRGGGFRDQAGFVRAATRHSDPMDGVVTDPGTGAKSASVDQDYFGYYDQNGEIVGFRCVRAD